MPTVWVVPARVNIGYKVFGAGIRKWEMGTGDWDDGRTDVGEQEVERINFGYQGKDMLKR